MELFSEAKKSESSTKDPLWVFLFAQGSVNKALTPKGIWNDQPLQTPKDYGTF